MAESIQNYKHPFVYLGLPDHCLSIRRTLNIHSKTDVPSMSLFKERGMHRNKSNNTIYLGDSRSESSGCNQRHLYIDSKTNPLSLVDTCLKIAFQQYPFVETIYENIHTRGTDVTNSYKYSVYAYSNKCSPHILTTISIEWQVQLNIDNITEHNKLIPLELLCIRKQPDNGQLIILCESTSESHPSQRTLELLSDNPEIPHHRIVIADRNPNGQSEEFSFTSSLGRFRTGVRRQIELYHPKIAKVFSDLSDGYPYLPFSIETEIYPKLYLTRNNLDNWKFIYDLTKNKGSPFCNNETERNEIELAIQVEESVLYNSNYTPQNTVDKYLSCVMLFSMQPKYYPFPQQTLFELFKDTSYHNQNIDVRLKVLTKSFPSYDSYDNSFIR